MLLLLSLAASAAKAAKASPPPPPLLELVRDAALFKAPYGWIFYAALVGFCVANGLTISKGYPNVRYVHGLALGVLMSFGGSMMTALMCAKPAVFAVNEALLPTWVSVWSVLWFLPSVINSFLAIPFLGATILSLSYETFRAHVMINCAKMASSALTAASSGVYPVPIAGPLIAGVLGGCGGGFMPPSKGLAPLEQGANWRVASAAIGSLWLQLLLNDPYARAHAAAVLPPLADPEWVKFSVIAFFTLAPLLQWYMPDMMPWARSNPLVTVPPRVSAGKKNK